jgi:hypothetical protein
VHWKCVFISVVIQRYDKILMWQNGYGRTVCIFCSVTSSLYKHGQYFCLKCTVYFLNTTYVKKFNAVWVVRTT